MDFSVTIYFLIKMRVSWDVEICNKSFPTFHILHRRHTDMCLQHNGSVGIDLAYPPFPFLICSYLPCHSTLYTVSLFKI